MPYNPERRKLFVNSLKVAGGALGLVTLSSSNAVVEPNREKLTLSPFDVIPAVSALVASGFQAVSTFRDGAQYRPEIVSKSIRTGGKLFVYTKTALALAGCGDIPTPIELNPPQIWYGLQSDGKNQTYLKPTSSPTPNPPIEMWYAPPHTPEPKAWYGPLPEKHFTTVNIPGIGESKVGGTITSGKYDFVPIVSLNALSITANQLIAWEGTGNLSTVYSVASDGMLLLQGILLPYALARASITGSIQDAIEGPIQVRVNGDVSYVYRSDLSKTIGNQKVEIAQASADANTQARAQIVRNLGGMPFPPHDWKPPPDEYCGENLKEMFALLLLDSMTIMAMLHNDSIGSAMRKGLTDTEYDKLFKNTPITKDIDKYLERQNKIDKSLKDKGCYLYSQGGSVFMDYKYMRQIAYLRTQGLQIKAGELPGVYQNLATNQNLAKISEEGAKFFGAKFNPNLTTDQAYELAKSLVEQYFK